MPLDHSLCAIHRRPVHRSLPSDPAPLVLLADDGVSVMVRALRPIKKGEEITNNYQPGVIHRPDMSLYIYGACG